MDLEELGLYIRSGERCHLVGIGGVSMSPLAEVLRGMGVPITGSDIRNGPMIDRLRSVGIDVTIGHRTGNVDGAGFIIRTAAARDDNIEISTARAAGIPVFERAQAWGYIMRGYENAVCVSGVHGKTTTTSMVAHILLAAESDPTIMIGGVLPVLGSGYRVGEGNVIAIESDEYYNSYHSFFPTVAVVLNVDADHLDFFKDLDDLKSSFRAFADLVPRSGHIVCNGDDRNTMEALAPLGRELLTFGHGEAARVRGVNVHARGRNPSMNVLYDGEPFCDITLKVPGAQNLLNALAATAATLSLGISPEAISAGLSSYTGVGRRFEYKGNINGADIYDDYAHHPSELRALLDAVATLDYERIIIAFQPHTFSRTRALFSDFVAELSRADKTYLAEIYAAREKKDNSVSSDTLADAITGARCCASFGELADRLAGDAGPGDIILTVGAGDIYQVGDTLAVWGRNAAGSEL
ncbi:MAG: UDP-N-acetylmuramate--L-alanine ligase [Oscillospiraceae bacterium]|nr:UDP-N-acetylmuramate--L-alanine ligase [Oscillospiraceae bacterium]